MADRRTRHRPEVTPRGLDRFGVLLGLTITSIVMLALVDVSDRVETTGAALVVYVESTLVAVTFLLSLRAAGVARKWRRIADVLVGIGIAGSTVAVLLDVLSDSERHFTRGAPSVAMLALAVLSPVAIVQRLLSHPRVGVQTLLGAVAAYLQIALGSTLIFLAVDGAQSTDFFGSDQPTTSFMYFSLTTVTTLGYGDLAPVTALGRLLASSEAIIGQVFLVTFVAMFVGLFVQRRGEPAEDEAPAPE